MNNDPIPLHADLVQTPAKIFAFLFVALATYAAAATVESAVLHGPTIVHALILFALLTQILLLHRLGLGCKQVYRTDRSLIIRSFQFERQVPWASVQQLRVPWWGGVAKWRIHEITLDGDEKIFFYASTDHIRQLTLTDTPRPSTEPR